jgi:hypothetical protein
MIVNFYKDTKHTHLFLIALEKQGDKLKFTLVMPQKPKIFWSGTIPIITGLVEN